MDNPTRSIEKRLRLESEVDLSLAVGISPAMMGHVRAGRRPLPMPAKFRLLDKLGYPMTREVILSALPDDVRVLIAEIDERRGH